MSLNPVHLAELVIRPALHAIGLHSPAAEELVLGTACQESGLRHLQQLARKDGRRGPALGLWQMEPATHADIWTHYLRHQGGKMWDAIWDLAGDGTERVTVSAGGSSTEILIPSRSHLTGNLWYAAALCRVHYRRVSAPLPNAGDIKAQAAYWKRWYNTPAGAGTAEEYERAWDRIVVAGGAA